VTGSGGLIGSESVRHFARQGFEVIGLENDMRAYFFGPEASTRRTTETLLEELEDSFRSLDVDIRDEDTVSRVISEHAARLELVVHTSSEELRIGIDGG